MQILENCCSHSSTFLCRVIEEEMSVFWRATVSIVVRKKKLFKHVSHSEWLSR